VRKKRNDHNRIGFDYYNDPLAVRAV